MSNNSATPESFWAEMMSMYGIQFINSFGEKPDKRWRDFINSLEYYQYLHILVELDRSGSKFPPSRPEVKALARSAHKPPNPNQAAIAAEHREYTPEQCEANLKKLKRITQAASSGEFNGLSELQIEKIIEDW